MTRAFEWFLAVNTGMDKKLISRDFSNMKHVKQGFFMEMKSAIFVISEFEVNIHAAGEQDAGERILAACW